MAEETDTPAKEVCTLEKKAEAVSEVKKEEKPVEKPEVDENEAKIANGNAIVEKEPPTKELLEKIKKQIEFYFGDVNLQRDKWLIDQTKLDEGWIPMSVMLNFKMLAALSTDIDVILQSLEDSELMEISEDKKKIRRSSEKPLPEFNEEYRKAQEERTVYLKGFPSDTTVQNIKDYFKNDQMENIILRRYKKGKEWFFKGSIFIQFKTLESAKEFMAQESIKYNDVELIKEWSAIYCAGKEKEKEERRKKKGGNKKSDKKEDGEATKEDKKEKSEEFVKKFPKGAILHLTNLDKSTDRDAIKDEVAKKEVQVIYVEYKLGNEEAWVRLQGENSAVEFLKKLESNIIKIQDSDVTCRVLEGEEEAAYLQKVQEEMTSFRSRDKGGRGGKRGTKRRHSPHRGRDAKKPALA